MAYMGTSANTQSAALDRQGAGAGVGDFIALLKPRVMSLVVFTAIVGMLLAPVGVHPVIFVIAIASIAIGGGASGALNMWYESDIDALMSRTRNRPIPAGRVDRGQALGFGLVLSVGSVALLGLASNWLAAALLAFTIFFYAVIYTIWLKRRTAQNIVIGGAAGAFPAMIGWAAATGSIGIEPVILFMIVFLWTPPHFWALALYKKGDYAAANIPMLPNVAGERVTKIQILVYSLLLAAFSLLPFWLGFAGIAYGLVAGASGLGMVGLSVHLLAASGKAMRVRSRRLFSFSLLYLFVVFLALLLETLVLRSEILTVIL